MIADWNLWPWIVAEGAGEVSIATMRIERAFQHIQSEIGMSLYPVMREFARTARRFLREHPEVLA